MSLDTSSAIESPLRAKTADIYRGGIIHTIFPSNLELLPNTNQLWEIDMAYGELSTLGFGSPLIQRCAFFGRVDGVETNHFRICKDSPLQVDKQSSIRRQTFFNVNQFKTGYATHGLFPYRGKFHPQLVKAIMNIIRLESEETVLNPMAGSGTVSIEAALNGIHSIAVDISPFCSLMTRAKTEALTVDSAQLRADFELAAGSADALGITGTRQIDLFHHQAAQDLFRDAATLDMKHRDIVLLAHLDAMGYAARRVNKTASQLFGVISDRYLSAIERFQTVRAELGLSMGNVDVRTDDARALPLADASVDAIITSPPYSFAVDYAENDRPQLEYLGYDIDDLKRSMVGLTGGKAVHARVAQYFADMRTIFGELARVLKRGRHCVVVIGSNEIQTGGIRHDVEFAKYAREVGFQLSWDMIRPIEGIRNSMRDEHVMFFRRC